MVEMEDGPKLQLGVGEVTHLGSAAQDINDTHYTVLCAQICFVLNSTSTLWLAQCICFDSHAELHSVSDAAWCSKFSQLPTSSIADVMWTPVTSARKLALPSGVRLLLVDVLRWQLVV